MEATSLESSLDYLSVLTALILGSLVILVWKLLNLKEVEAEPDGESEPEGTGDGSGNSKKNGVKKSSKSRSKMPKRATSVPVFTHDLLHTTLKGHTGNVFCLESSLNGKYLASCSDDQSVRLWSVKDFGTGNKSVRVNVEFDHANLIRFSPDNRAFIAGLGGGNTVRVFRLGKKDDGVTTTCVPLDQDFPEYTKAKLLNIGIGSSSNGGSFVMTAYKDTTILIRDLKGNILHTLNTNQGNNECAWVSPCGRFVGSSGWAPDVRVWAVNFTKTGDYRDVTEAFVLEGHGSSVWSFAFNLDSTRMLTVSKDGSWRLFDTDIEYAKGQDPYLLKKGVVKIHNVSITDHPCVCAISSDGLVAAVSCLNNITVFSTNTGETEMEAAEAHSEIITSLTFDIGGRYLLSTGDRFIRVFHNTLNYKEKIKALEDSLKSQIPSAMRERQEKQLKELEKSLNKIYLSQKEKQK